MAINISSNASQLIERVRGLRDRSKKSRDVLRAVVKRQKRVIEGGFYDAAAKRGTGKENERPVFMRGITWPARRVPVDHPMLIKSGKLVHNFKDTVKGRVGYVTNRTRYGRVQNYGGGAGPQGGYIDPRPFMFWSRKDAQEAAKEVHHFLFGGRDV